MKDTTTIRQRLNRTLVLLLILFLFGIGPAFWIQRQGSEAEHRSDRLTSAKDRLYFEVLQISDAVRGLLAEPKSELERKHLREADQDLKSRIDEIQHS
jgi:hypothetical protein